MQLTTNWQTISSDGLITNVTEAVEGRYTSQNTAENYTDIEARIINYASNSAQWRTTSGNSRFTGEFSDSGSCATYPNYVSNGSVLLTISKRVYHRTDGTMSFNLGGHVDAVLGGTRYNSNPPQTEVVLPAIPRYAIAEGATDFNDEQNPTLWYKNPQGDNVTTLEAYIVKHGTSTTLVGTRNLPKTGTSYTFELTTSERNALRNAYTSSSTGLVDFVVHTKLNGVDYYSSLTRTLSIVNANPTFNVAYQDTNATTTTITQNNQQLIQNNSTLQINITSAAALKGASLSSAKVTINGVTTTESINSSTLNIDIGTLDITQNTNASVTLTDSRGLTTTQTLTLTILDWELPTAIIYLNRQSNYYTETDILADGTCSSLDSKNTLTLQYRIKKTSENTWGAWNNLTDNTTTTFNADNQYSWDVQVRVSDSIGASTYNLSLGVGTPILFIDRHIQSVAVNGFPKGYQTLEVNGADISNNYSGYYERVIGKWVDGKPIYRKVIDFGQLPNDSQKSVEHYIDNLDMVVRLSGVAFRNIPGYEVYFPLPYVDKNPNNTIQLNATLQYINIATATDRSNIVWCYVIIEYTKTTDNALN